MLKHITGVFDKIKAEIDKVGQAHNDIKNQSSKFWNSSMRSSHKKSIKKSDNDKKMNLNSPVYLSPRKTKLFRKLKSKKKSEQLDTVEEAI